jgi:hypothetical protein
MVETGSFLRGSLIALVIVIWGVLAVGLYLYLQKREKV